VHHINKLLSVVAIFLVLLSSPVMAEEGVDPWQNWNRKVYSFNEGLDDYVARPVAKAYKAVLPKIVRRGVGNFFSNLGEVPTAINDLLQAKPGQAFKSASRFVVNSTVGLWGLIDIATMAGIEEHSEDFGQTLAVWGVESGPYIVLPILGPSNVRDAFSLYPDNRLDPMSHLPLSDPEYYGLTVLKYTHIRHKLLDSEAIIQGDKYTFIRDAYLQNRIYEINDGQVEDSFDDDFDDLDLDEDY
jgi:phospholipid-binding lipoprotein MlaA